MGYWLNRLLRRSRLSDLSDEDAEVWSYMWVSEEAEHYYSALADQLATTKDRERRNELNARIQAGVEWKNMIKMRILAGVGQDGAARIFQTVEAIRRDPVADIRLENRSEPIKARIRMEANTFAKGRAAVLLEEVAQGTRSYDDQMSDPIWKALNED